MYYRNVGLHGMLLCCVVRVVLCGAVWCGVVLCFLILVVGAIVHDLREF